MSSAAATTRRDRKVTKNKRPQILQCHLRAQERAPAGSRLMPSLPDAKRRASHRPPGQSLRHDLSFILQVRKQRPRKMSHHCPQTSRLGEKNLPKKRKGCGKNGSGWREEGRWGLHWLELAAVIPTPPEPEKSRLVQLDLRKNFQVLCSGDVGSFKGNGRGHCCQASTHISGLVSRSSRDKVQEPLLLRPPACCRTRPL